MSQLDELVAEAELGEEAKNFLKSDLCKCLCGFAEQEVKVAQEALESVDPDDTKQIVLLQNKIRLFRTFNQWLVELVTRGENAKDVYIQSRSS